MGKYQLIRKLATGGMAEVFLAKAAGPMGFEKVLVVKRILPHLAEDPDFIEMFLAEAKLAAQLNHANIVQIFDFGEQDGAYFLAMEYVDGPNLRTLARRAFQEGSSIPHPLSARLVALACEGLAFAHELTDAQTGEPLGLIHRDISTDNILVSRTGGVKVVDFGIAKAANASPHTRTGTLKGKVAYMSPEHLMGKPPLDARTDIYALGVVLYELITGRKPFDAQSDVQMVQAIIHESPIDVRTLRTDVPAELVAILDKALAKDREARYRGCWEMQEDLERFLFRCGEPVGAPQLAELVRQLIPVLPGDGMEVPRSNPAPQRLVPEPRSPPSRPRIPLAPPSPQAETVVASPVEPAPEPSRRGRRLAPALLLLAAGLLLLVGGRYALGEMNRPAEPPPPPPRAPVLAPVPTARAPAPPPAEPPDAGPREVAELPEPATPVTPDETEREAVPAEASDGSTLRVHSNLRAYVRINGKLVGRTPLVHTVAPGWLRVEVTGATRDGRFDKSQVIELKTGESRQVSFAVQKVQVTIRGRPDDMKVISMDGKKLGGKTSVSTYEGKHRLELLHTPTGKSHTSECEVRPGDKLCKFFVQTLQ
ncbi:MAG TPA: serine/threonine-protein kinase [Archangium sp.]|uniref:serine/threonine protein kinase n=1 Tax=Archangium sp. TaxID=1872627 RepID=UPI002E3442D1|nr:serine/threonine-protein kinase [Archangium sp.]HEX5752829.1 serine/threonine-protein kinase [Archangium sp.]